MRSATKFRRAGVFPAVLVLLLCGLTLSALSATACYVGTRGTAEERFINPGRAPTVDEASFTNPIEYALSSYEFNDVIFVGDSTCHDGIDPKQFESLTHLRAYNLGSQAGVGPLGVLITATAYLERHPKPKAVVLCLSPFCLEEDAGSLGGWVGERFVASYRPEVTGGVSPVVWVDYFVKRGAVKFADDASEQELEDVVDLPLVGLESETYRTLREKMAQSRGFFRLPGPHGYLKPMDHMGQKLRIHREWTDAVHRLAETCAARGVKFVVRFMPLSAAIAQARDFRPLEEWCSELESSEHAIVLRPVVMTYDKELCWDHIHLNNQGVEKFTSEFARALRAAVP
jgi:hypothetical protein